MLQELKCVIVDDDKFIVEMLNDLCKNRPYITITNSFNCPKEFLKSLPQLDFDVCLLNTCMPGADDLFLTQQIKDRQIIFVTGSDDMLRKALDISHFDVITKPIKIDRFNDAIDRAYRLVNNKKRENKEYHFFNIAGSKEKVRLRLSDIFLVTTDSADTEYKHLFLSDGQQYRVTDCTLKELCEYSKLFLQPNKSELVTPDAIHKIVDNRTIILNRIKENGRQKQVFLTRIFKKSFLQQV
jgi:DNA-binding LytR/AlgR family response regulator